MSKEKIKVYLYTRVSTAMQIDGYSLEAQKTKMKAFVIIMSMKLPVSMRTLENPVNPLKEELLLIR